MSVSFADLGVPAHLLAVLDGQGIAQPWPIQAATLPDALTGADVSGRAPTGSGKTLAFAIPAVLAARPPAPAGRRAERRGELPGRPRALVLVPTRELAAQVERTLAPLARAAGSRTLAVYGGVGYGPQRNALRRGAEILVGCPGRLEDLISQGDLDLGEVSFVVVDEADRMADMGFLPAVRRLLDATRTDRQTLLFSATLDGEVDVLVKRYQTDPRRHEVAPEADSGEVHHFFWKVDHDKRVAVTGDLVRTYSPAVVFCRTRHGADRLARRLGNLGIEAAAIHGDRSQAQRERALSAFASGRVSALVATDVAARGIHVDDVACVIHYDLPADPKDYVHRSGRTGRAGATGLVVGLVGSDQVKAATALKRSAGIGGAVIDPDFGALPPAPPARPAPAPEAAPAPARSPERPRGPRSAEDRSRRRKPRDAQQPSRYAGSAGGGQRDEGRGRNPADGRAGGRRPARRTGAQGRSGNPGGVGGVRHRSR